MVRRDVVARKVGRATAKLNEAEALLANPQGSTRDRDLASFYLFVAIQECIDLGAHWIVDAGWMPADDAGSSFDILADRGAIDSDLADQMRAAAGLRNRIAHGYADIDLERLATEAPAGMAALRRFLLAVSDAAGL